MDKESFYWLFSTAAETIATLAGLFFAGICFVYSKIDNIIEKDFTLKDIYEKIKNQIFKGIILIITLTGVSVIYDIINLLVVPKMKGNALIDLIVIISIVINTLTIGIIIYYIYQVMNPRSIIHTANKLVKKYVPQHSNQSIPIETFIDHFTTLERILKNYSKECIHNDSLSLQQIIDNLYSQGKINRQQMQFFIITDRLRNLYVHGGNIKNIQKEYDDILQNLTSSLNEEIHKEQ